MKKQFFLIITSILVLSSCGGGERPEIPLTEREIAFFDELNHHPLTIDSVTRKIEIRFLLWRTFSKDVLIEVYSYSTADSLTVKEWDALSDKIAGFYSTDKIADIQFMRCSIIYHWHIEQSIEMYHYTYYFENKAIVSRRRPSEFNRDEKKQALQEATD